MKKIICKNCSDSFIGKFSFSKFCCKKCCANFHNKIRNRTIHKLEKRICGWCKSEYMPKINKSKYCSTNCNRYKNAYRYPDKFKARHMLAYAIQTGYVIRPTYCEGCLGNCKPHGHHKDYSKPLEVVWLCIKCHRKEHEILNASNANKDRFELG